MTQQQTLQTQQVQQQVQTQQVESYVLNMDQTVNCHELAYLHAKEIKQLEKKLKGLKESLECEIAGMVSRNQMETGDYFIDVGSKAGTKTINAAMFLQRFPDKAREIMVIPIGAAKKAVGEDSFSDICDHEPEKTTYTMMSRVL